MTDEGKQLDTRRVASVKMKFYATVRFAEKLRAYFSQYGSIEDVVSFGGCAVGRGRPLARERVLHNLRTGGDARPNQRTAAGVWFRDVQGARISGNSV